MAPGVGEVEASLIVEKGTELVVMLRDAEAFVESHDLPSIISAITPSLVSICVNPLPRDSKP